VFDRRGRDRPHVCALDSEAGPGIGSSGLARSDAHGNTSAQTMLGTDDVARKGARKCNTDTIAGNASLHYEVRMKCGSVMLTDPQIKKSINRNENCD
jgi:hypothetical protein